MPHTDSTRRSGNTLPALVSLVQYFHDEENPYGFPSYAVPSHLFFIRNNAPSNALGREVFPNTPKSDASLPDTASKALLRQIYEACGKRGEGKGREGKTNANYGANRAGKAVGKKAGGKKPEGRGEREKQQEGLAPSLRLGEGWPVMGMGFGQNKGPSWIGRPFGNKVLALFYFPT